MKYAGRTVKVSKYEIGATVRIKSSGVDGRVTKDEYREYNKDWYYKVKPLRGRGTTKWWKQTSLRKINI